MIVRYVMKRKCVDKASFALRNNEKKIYDLIFSLHILRVDCVRDKVIYSSKKKKTTIYTTCETSNWDFRSKSDVFSNISTFII